MPMTKVISAVMIATALVASSGQRANAQDANNNRGQKSSESTITLDDFAAQLQTLLAARGVKVPLGDAKRPKLPVTLPVKPPENGFPLPPPGNAPGPNPEPPPPLPPPTPFPTPRPGPFHPTWSEALKAFRDGADQYLKEADAKRQKGQMSPGDYAAAVAEHQRLVEIYNNSMIMSGTARP
jgi:hypothetical protein